MALPLEGIRVLDLTIVWAGPHATMLLADWGAEVIRIESTQLMQPNTRGRLAHPPPDLPRLRKDWGFAYPDWEPGENSWNRYPIFQSHARNKKSMTVDMLRPEGRDVAYDLFRTADIFIENNVPSTIEKLGLTYEELRRVRPDLIAVRMPAYGLDGPYKHYRSFGVQVESTAGHTLVRGYPDEDYSTIDQTYLGDGAAGASGAFAAVMALRHRMRTGKGQMVECSLGENFVPYLGESIMDWTMNGRVHTTLGNRRPDGAPQGAYPCAGDDNWVALSVTSDGEWAGLCEAMGAPELRRDPRFSSVLARFKHHDALDERIAQWSSGLSASDAAAVLQDHGVPAGPVLRDSELYADPQLAHDGFFKRFEHADAGTHDYPGLMWTMDRTPNELRTPPVRLGEHNDYVYGELLAYPAERRAALERGGHIGTRYASHIP